MRKEIEPFLSSVTVIKAVDQGLNNLVLMDIPHS